MEHHILLLGVDVCFHLHGNVTGQDRQQEPLLGEEADAFITAPSTCLAVPCPLQVDSSTPVPPRCRALRLVGLTPVCVHQRGRQASCPQGSSGPSPWDTSWFLVHVGKELPVNLQC